jgi:zinc protease
MTILIEHDPALPLIQFSISLGAGSQLDPIGKEGLTRLALRLMRRTGHGLAAEVLDERFDAMGSAVSSEVTVTSCGFAGSVITRSLDRFIELFSGVLCSPSLDEAEFERLKRETLAEIAEQRDSDQWLVQRWFRRKFYGAHPYGRGTTGTAKSIERITLADMRQFYTQNIGSNNLLFAFAGDISAEGAERVREKLCSKLAPGTAAPDLVPEPETRRGRHLVVVDKPERTQTQILIGCAGSHPKDADHIALSVANTAFGGTFTARLMQAIRAERGWSYGAYSSLSYDRRRQPFSMWCFPAATDAAACLGLELTMLSDFVEQGLKQEELDYAKRYLVNSNVFNTDTAVKRLGQKLEEVTYGLPEGYHAQFAQAVSQVTLEEVNAAVKNRLTTEDLTLIVVGTEAEIGSPVRDAVANLSSYEVIAYDAD